MNEEKMIINFEEKVAEQNVNAEPVEIEDSKVLGLYRTFSFYDLTLVKKIMKAGTAGKYFDISVLWSIFGQ